MQIDGLMRSVGSVPQKLFSAKAGQTWGVAPDGRHFLLEELPGGATLVTVTNGFDELRRRAPCQPLLLMHCTG